MRNDIQVHKQVAADFLKLVVSGQIDEAYRKYVDMQGKHHNLFFPAGFPALQNAMKDAHVQFPNKEFAIRNVIGDENLVAVHSHIVLKKGEKGMVVVHMFRFNGEKIVEMWDLGQPIPEDSPNKDGAF